MQGTLYVLFGSSGAGKTSIANAVVREQSDTFDLVCKRSDRPARADDTDIEHVRTIDLRDNQKYLGYLGNGGKTYLIDMEDMCLKLKAGRSQILIINNIMTIKLLTTLLPYRVKVVFIHRDMGRQALRAILTNRGLQGARLEKAVEERMVARNVFYHQIAADVIRPDHIVINDEIENAVLQFLLISQAEYCEDGLTKLPTLNIIIAGTGPAKDAVLRMVETVPNGRRLIVPKYLTRPRRPEDGVETRNVEAIPEHCLQFVAFGKKYGVDAEEAIAVVREHSVGFVTISNKSVALTLIARLKAAGIEGRLIYLHQTVPELSGYKAREAQKRREHARELLRLYQEVLIKMPRIPVILAENLDVLCASVQRLCIEAL